MQIVAITSKDRMRSLHQEDHHVSGRTVGLLVALAREYDALLVHHSRVDIHIESL